MSANGHKSLPTIGFLTVIDNPELGLTGGYLVLNTLARPLEFHCTAPVKTNRAQEILYGPTLKPFVYGEQIGQTLLEKSSFQPLFVCTDVSPALAVRDTTSTPVVLVLDPSATPAGTGVEAAASGERLLRVDGAHEPSLRLRPFALGQQQLAVSARFGDDAQRIIEHWQPYVDAFDLLEPFERIREAIAEAQGAR